MAGENPVFSKVLYFLMGAAVVLSVVMVWRYWSLRRLNRSTRQLIDAVRRIGTPGVTVRVPIPPEAPLAGLAREIGETASTVGQQTERLESQRNNLETVLASMSEGVLVADVRGRVARINDAFHDIFEVQGDPVGRMPLEVVRNEEIQTGIQRVLKERVPYEEELHVGEKVLLARFAPIVNEQTPLGVVTVFHDITALRRLERLRREFISNVSHELKTPLTSIRGYAETLLGEVWENPLHRTFLEKIFKNAQQLSQMIDDLFRLARLESGDRHVNRTEISFMSLMDELRTEFAPKLRAKSIRLQVENRSRADSFRADPAYIKRVFHNLLDNALKYTDQGEIKVSLDTSPEGFLFSVQDTGIGIPESELERIFERFYRVQKDRSRSAGGSGVGLAIVKHIVQLHGGKAWAESRLGQGTSVFFTLPA